MQEVRALVEILDVNGSNDLDLTEWNRFFYSRRISISEFGMGMHYSNKLLVVIHPLSR